MSSSSCVILTHPCGRQGIGVAQPNTGDDFPFVRKPSPTIRNLVADFHLSYTDLHDYNQTARAFKLPFKLYWLYGVGCIPNDSNGRTPTPQHAVDLIVVDATGCVVFDSTTATSFKEQDWADRLKVYRWADANNVCSLVVHTHWNATEEDIDTQDYYENIYPKEAELDARTIVKLPKRVRSITVAGEKVSSGDIDFVEGFNFNMSTNTVNRSARQATQILMAASPRSGLGQFEACESIVPYVRTINGVGPDNEGNFSFNADNCYYVRQPSATSPASLTANTLKIGNICKPCCGCQDYVASVEFMNALRDKYKDIGITLETARDIYHTNRDRWCAQACCFASKPIRAAFQPQLCPHLDVGAQFYNSSKQCLQNVQLNIAFDAIAGRTGDVQLGFTQIKGLSFNNGRRTGVIERYTVGGSWPNFTAAWPFVYPGQDIWVKFRLKFSGCGLDSGSAPLVPRACITGTINGSPILATDCTAGDCDTVPSVPAQACVQKTLRCPALAEDLYDYGDCIVDLL